MLIISSEEYLMDFQDLKVLILDDDERIREELSEFLTRRRSVVYSEEYPTKAFNLMQNKHIDVLFLDFALPEMDGLVVLRKMQQLYPKVSVIMISGTANCNLAEEAINCGAAHFLKKPFLHKEVTQAVEQLDLYR